MRECLSIGIDGNGSIPLDRSANTMKKLLAALAILGCLIGGTWFLYGTISSASDTSDSKASAPETIEPFESDSIAVSNRDSPSDETETRPSEQPESSNDEPSAHKSGSSESARSEGASNDPVETEAVVLNVEQDDPQSENDDTTSKETKQPSLRTYETLGELADEMPNEKNDTNRETNSSSDEIPKLSDEARERLLRGTEIQKPDIQTLPNGLKQLPTNLDNDMPIRQRK